MKVILLEEIKGIGKKNDVVEVSDGYAKNFLIKQKKAVAYTQKAQEVLKKDLQAIEDEEQQRILDASLLRDELEKHHLEFELKVNNLKTFGHITNKQIIDELNKVHKVITKHMLQKPYNLGVGEHQVEVQLHKKVIANIKVVVRGIS